MSHRSLAILTLACSLAVAASTDAGSGGVPIHFIDATDDVGLGGLSAARVAFADLNANGRPDAIIDRHRIFINTPDEETPLGFRFIEVDSPGLPIPRRGDLVVFADLNNDGFPDAIIARYLDINSDNFEPPADPPARTAWLPGHGDGTFGEPRIIDAAPQATTSSIAVGDVDLDGRLDLYLGNWYTHYGRSFAGFPNDLLLQTGSDDEVVYSRQPLPEDAHEFDDELDAAGRPTYGVMIANVLIPPSDNGAVAYTPGVRYPQLLELNYGRRANRLWAGSTLPRPDLQSPRGRDLAPAIGFDGDDIRHGRHPDWLKIIAQRDQRFDRADEMPFRSHGNTFDVAVGDVTNDGAFDLFLAEITHGWAGDSSDRSRLLIAETADDHAPIRLEESEHSFDRIPHIPPEDEWPEGWFPRWNQGDLFCEFADLNNSGLLDVIISSGDYPDPPPYDQRLRIYRQNEDGSFTDVTSESGIDHIGSQQLSLGDVNGNGRLDILVGQTFTRFSRDMIEAAGGEPRLRLFLNVSGAPDRDQSQPAPDAITLKLNGDPAHGVNRDALGAIVRLSSDAPGRAANQSRQLIGIGGHAGKQHQFLIHFGLGPAERASRIDIHWPAHDQLVTTLHDLPPGRHTVHLNQHLADGP